MGRQPCCEKVGLRKGSWTAEEDKRLISFILSNGHCCWRAVPKLAGLLRCGKSCRLRWTNYLRPDLKRGLLSESEEQLIIDLHSKLGNRWSKIAAHLPGRTDNEIKNHWNTHIKKKLKKLGLDPSTHKPITGGGDDGQQQLLLPQDDQQVGCKDDDHKADDHHHQIPPPPPPPPAAAAAGTLLIAKKEDTAVALEDDDLRKEEEEINNLITSASSPSPYNSFFHPHDQMTMTMMMDAALRSPAFCTDEVPMIQPGEIVDVPTASSSVSSTCSSATSNFSVLPEELRSPCCMEWSESAYAWGMDAFNGFDFIYDDDDNYYYYGIDGR